MTEAEKLDPRPMKNLWENEIEPKKLEPETIEPSEIKSKPTIQFLQEEREERIKVRAKEILNEMGEEHVRELNLRGDYPEGLAYNEAKDEIEREEYLDFLEAGSQQPFEEPEYSYDREGNIVFVKPEDEARGEEAISLFLSLFNKFSFRNTIYAHQIFHLILGQLFKDLKISYSQQDKDLRAHIFYSASSGSGKSIGLRILEKICKDMDIKLEIVTGEISEAGLVGSFSQDNINGQVINTPLPGMLQGFNNGGIIFFDETEMLMKLQERDYNSATLFYLQGIMNNYYDLNSIIKKRLKSGEVVIHSKASCGFITFPVRTRMLEILKTGFFQRMLPYARVLTPEEWLALSNEIIESMYDDMKIGDNIFLNVSKTQAFQYGFNKFIALLKDVEKYVKGVKVIGMGEGCLAYLKLYNSDINEKFKY
ncbi:MAG: hypothetical protein AABY07_09230, partial [Nanoarchaeota archaeon]